MSGPPRTIRIHYHRPPDRHDIFEQLLVHEPAAGRVATTGRQRGGRAPTSGRLSDGYITLLSAATISRPMVVEDRTVLEPGSPVVWVTFPGAWHDIGRFHTRDGRFTGYYANVLTPVELKGDDWHTTDLFVDVFLPADGRERIMDADELDDAVAHGWLDRATGDRAMAEAERLIELAGEGAWPPPIAREWTLERAREVAA